MLKQLRLHPLFGPDDNPPPGSPPPGDPPPAAPPAEFKPEEWKNLLPEEMRDNPAIRDLATPEALVNSFTEAQSLIGSSIRVPSAEASAEDVAAFHQTLMDKAPGVMLKPDMANAEARDAIYTQLGRPEKGEDYQVPEIDAKGLDLDHSMTDAFRPLAHKAGLNQDQFNLIVGEISKINIDNAFEQQKQHDAAMHTLAQEWGATFEDRMKTISNFAQQMRAPSGLITALQNNKADVATVKWLYEMSEAMPAEGAGINRDAQNQSTKMTPAEAKNRIAEIYRNKDHAFWNAEDPNHEDAIALMIELRKLADPSAGTDINDLRATVVQQ